MHIIRMDIDRKNSAEHLQVGPLGCGLNAIFSTATAGSSAMARFIKGLLFRGHCSSELNFDEETEAIDGSLQWADASGHVRLMSYSGGSPLLPLQFIHSPLHPSERPLHSDEGHQIRGLGNTLWEGGDQDGRWDELRGDILGMVFCSPLGTISPEKLWWAASRLGVHGVAKRELDEGYQRLKVEEQELLERLRNAESVDHDRAWWSIERDRIASELAHLQDVNLQASAKAERCCQSCSPSGNAKIISIQGEIARLRSLQQESIVKEANSQLNEHRTDGLRAHSGSMLFNNVSLHNASIGKSKSTSDRGDFVLERQRLQNRIEQLQAELSGIELEPRGAAFIHPDHLDPPVKRWDDTQLRQQHTHADEMLRRWDRRAQTHRRLVEVQSHLRTRSPYRRTTEGSLIPLTEKYLRELTSGAVRQLPPWAVEASHDEKHVEPGYRNANYENNLPNGNTRQRKLVDLAMRLAIAESSMPRIGRIPMLLDDTLGGFQGESLEQILHVLSAFARNGRQLLLATNDEYIARRIAAHGGMVSRMLEVMRYAHPSYVLEGQYELGMHPNMAQSAISSTANDTRPLRIVSAESPDIGIRELNRQLTDLANEQATGSWWIPSGARLQPQSRRVERPNEFASGGRRFFLQLDSPIQDAPSITSQLMHRMNAAGVFRVADLLRAPSSKLSAMIQVEPAMLEQIQRVAELMCGTPQLRAFDAQVLVGCGIARSIDLRSMPAAELVRRVESFLSSAGGQDLMRNATSFEVSRIHTWIADMRRSYRSHVSKEVVPIRAERYRNRDRARRETSYETRPRIVRSAENSDTYSPPVSAASDVDTIARSHRVRSQRNSSTRTTNEAPSSQWKFHLDIESPVVDAPSIGPRMSERLSSLQIASVGDLVAANAERVATQLADRTVSTEVVQQWQHQAMLVCRVPNLRGHDAQLIVGCGLISAEELAQSDSTELFNRVVRLVSSKQGVRILRGSKAPDHAEVSDWIQWAQNCRAVRAA